MGPRLAGTQQNRPDSTPLAHLLDNLRVHDNLICATVGGHPTGVVADNGANLAARDITFTSNPIQLAACQRLTVHYDRIARHRESQTLAVRKPATYRCLVTDWFPPGRRGLVSRS